MENQKKKKTVVRNKKPKPPLGSGKWIGSYKSNWGEVFKEPEPQGGLVETSSYTSEFMGNDAERIKRLLEIDRKYKKEDEKKAKKQKESNVKDIQSKMMAGSLDLEAKEWYDRQTGIEYMQVWDDENNRWLITNPETNEGIGYLDKQGKLIKY
jgi:dolichyl-phosphate-mannose--protein O-mannosyl transferase